MRPLQGVGAQICQSRSSQVDLMVTVQHRPQTGQIGSNDEKG
jgi:hypothetical protein